VLSEVLLVWLNVIGWTATAVFSTSYFFKEAATLRKIQAAAATLWVFYGVAIHSAPVVAANLLEQEQIQTSFQRNGTEGGQGH